MVGTSLVGTAVGTAAVVAWLTVQFYSRTQRGVIVNQMSNRW